MTEQEWYAALESRHGTALQKTFSEAWAAVCGLGGLGSNVAISLARSGIGNLILIDFDRVDLSNLNRQQYSVSQLGMYKTEAMKQTLSEIAPYCNVRILTERITPENCHRLLEQADLICECFDRAEDKAMLVDAVSEELPEKYLIASSGMSGLHSCNLIRTKRLTKRLYLCGDGESNVETDGTLFAPRVMLCAAHQAGTVLRILAEQYDV